MGFAIFVLGNEGTKLLARTPIRKGSFSDCQSDPGIDIATLPPVSLIPVVFMLDSISNFICFIPVIRLFRRREGTDGSLEKEKTRTECYGAGIRR